MHVLYLIDSLAGGGAEAVVAHLANYWAQNEPHVTCDVLTLYPTAEKFLFAKTFPFYCLNLDSKYSIKGVKGLVLCLSKSHYDIVHVHLFPANYYAAIASLFFPNIKWIHTEHSVWNRRRQFSLARIMETAIYSRFDVTIAVSYLVATSLKRWLPLMQSNIEVIPNGVVVPELPKQSVDIAGLETRTILFAGRLEYVKGVDILLEALTYLPSPVKLLLAGDGSQRIELEKLASTLGVARWVRFLGFQSNIQQLMSKVDCVVLPSRWEGLPMVALEAMAVGAPVVATTVGGLPEVIVQSETGWLVPPEDPRALAQAISKVLTDKGQSRSVGQNARQRIIESYSVDAMAQKTLDIYLRVLNQPKNEV